MRAIKLPVPRNTIKFVGSGEAGRMLARLIEAASSARVSIRSVPFCTDSFHNDNEGRGCSALMIPVSRAPRPPHRLCHGTAAGVTAHVRAARCASDLRGPCGATRLQHRSPAVAAIAGARVVKLAARCCGRALSSSGCPGRVLSGPADAAGVHAPPPLMLESLAGQGATASSDGGGAKDTAPVRCRAALMVPVVQQWSRRR